jgi:hypothetical protein
VRPQYVLTTPPIDRAGKTPVDRVLTQHSDDDRAAELVLDRWLKERQ